jgi:sec-independent protein translocase protein TatB
MFGIDSGEILIIAVVALVVIGPKDLPRVMRTIGNFVGRARGMARHFRSGLDAMVREAELEDMEKKWKAENERIMREHPYPAASAPTGAAPDPALAGDSDWGKPLAGEAAPVSPAPPLAGAAPPIPPAGAAALPASAAPPIPPSGAAPTPPADRP